METSLRGKRLETFGGACIVLMVLTVIGGMAWESAQAQDPRQQRRINADRNRRLDEIDRNGLDQLRAPAQDNRGPRAKMEEAHARAKPILDRLSKEDRLIIIEWANSRSDWAVLHPRGRASHLFPAQNAATPRPKNSAEDHLKNAQKMNDDPTVPKELVQRRLKGLIEQFPGTAAARVADEMLKKLVESKDR